MLDVRANKLDATAGKALAEALAVNKGLRSLDVGFNRLGTEGAPPLLATSSMLSAINLSWNGIGAEGAPALADALERNCTLKSCDLRSNELEGAGKQAIREAVSGRAGQMDLLL